MANLANIIKNIDPPIDLTQSEYNSLSTEQKNGGNVFYIEDGSGKKQVAVTTSTEDSNVQKELDQIDDTLTNIISGPIDVYSAKYIKSTHQDGAFMDDYGNFIHNSDDVSSNWAIMSLGQTRRPLNVYYETGSITSRKKGSDPCILVYGEGDTFTGQYKDAGNIVSGSKTIRIQIPIHHSANYATLTNLKLLAIQWGGGYAYMKYDSSTIQLNSMVQIWKNSAQVYANSISSISTSLRNGTVVLLNINFVNPLTVSATGANIVNYTPIGLIIEPTIVFS